MAGMSDEMRAKIESLQPYNGMGRHCTNYLLGLLNRLGNIEKHRHFNLIAASVDLAAFSLADSYLSDFHPRRTNKRRHTARGCKRANGVEFYRRLRCSVRRRWGGGWGISAGTRAPNRMLGPRCNWRVGLVRSLTILIQRLGCRLCQRKGVNSSGSLVGFR
jgi:hypothetical protein